MPSAVMTSGVRSWHFAAQCTYPMLRHMTNVCGAGVGQRGGGLAAGFGGGRLQELLGFVSRRVHTEICGGGRIRGGTERGALHSQSCCDGGDPIAEATCCWLRCRKARRCRRSRKRQTTTTMMTKTGIRRRCASRKFPYGRDGKDRLQAIDARTSCTVNGKFEPPIKVSRFEWKASKKRFLQRSGD